MFEKEKQVEKDDAHQNQITEIEIENERLRNTASKDSDPN
jgi:hypothetical protein